MLVFYLDEIGGEENRKKFEEIYLSYRDEMFSISNRILRHRENAEDAVQDAFVVIMRKLDEIQDIYSKKTANYIRTIVKNEAIRICNQCMKMETPVEDKKLLIELMEEFPDVEGNLDRKKLIDQLSGMLLELPEKYRAVLCLYYYEEMSFADIAEALEITHVNARQVARRARMILEEMMTERGLKYE